MEASGSKEEKGAKSDLRAAGRRRRRPTLLYTLLVGVSCLGIVFVPHRLQRQQRPSVCEKREKRTEVFANGLRGHYGEYPRRRGTAFDFAQTVSSSRSLFTYCYPASRGSPCLSFGFLYLCTWISASTKLRRRVAEAYKTPNNK